MIETERLVLRAWRDDDVIPLRRIGQDLRVMQFWGPLMDVAAARALVAGQIVNQSLFGHCYWPIERRDDAALLGFCGLNPGPKATPLEHDIEIGWFLTSHAWGKSYAYEAAQACLDWAWSNLANDRIATATVPANIRSRSLMERLGMRQVLGADFDHPALAEDDPLRRHVLYRIDRPALTPAGSGPTAA